MQFKRELNHRRRQEKLKMTKHDSDHIAHIHDELQSHLPSEPALRAKALESLLVEKAW